MKDQKRNHLSRIKILIWNIGIFSVTVSINTKYNSICASESNGHRFAETSDSGTDKLMLRVSAKPSGVLY